MVQAKVGYEDLYDAIVTKQSNLEVEKENKKSEAIQAIDSEYAKRSNELAVLFEQVSTYTEDPVEDPVEDTAEDTAESQDSEEENKERMTNTETVG